MIVVHSMLAMQRRGALLFRPVEDAALVMDECAGRAAVVLSSGEMAHCPGPASDIARCGFVEIRPGVFANPRHARAVAGRARESRVRPAGASASPPRSAHRSKSRQLAFPGGWIFRDVPPLPSPAPPSPAAAPSVQVTPAGAHEGVRTLPASSVVYVARSGSSYRLRTVDGDIPLRGRPRELVAGHPHLAATGAYHVNVRHLREIASDGRRFHLRFATGDAVAISMETGPAAARSLGLPDLRRLDDGAVQRALYDEGLRDWPRPLLDVPARELRAALGEDRRAAIANVLWQVVRLRSMDAAPDYGRDHRGFWYLPLFPVLNRLGMLREAPVETRSRAQLFDADRTEEALSLRPLQSPPHDSAHDADRTEEALSLRPLQSSHGGAGVKDRVYLQYQRVLGDLVGERRLFTYRDLGFDDARPDLRAVGATRPDLVLVVEKSSLLRTAADAARRFGCSFVVLGGESTWLAVEFFAEALRPTLAPGQRVQVVAYVDFDPAGWLIADSFVRQLARYGVETESLRHLVLPERFTKAEIAAVAYPLAAATPSSRTLVRNWIRRSGGVGKRGLGIHADHLRPLERVLEAIREATGLCEAKATP